MGRISKEEDDSKVEYVVRSIVNIFNFEPITTIQQNFKSYKFTISLFDKEIIKNKSLWPKGTIVSRYKRPFLNKQQPNTNKENQTYEPTSVPMSTENNSQIQLINSQISILSK